MDTIAQGRASEAAVVAKLTEAGHGVLIPFAGGAPYDLAVETRAGGLLRIQVKTGRVRNHVVIFNAVSSDHGHGHRAYQGLADVFAVNVPELGAVFMVAVEAAFRSKASLRLRPARNGQLRGIRFAADHTFERWCDTVQPAD